MKYLTSGLLLFFLYLFNTILVPRFFSETHLAPYWWSAIGTIIAVLFIIFGIQTIRLEKKYVAGVLFFLLSGITLLTYILANSMP